jgi:hypothetical protein
VNNLEGPSEMEQEVARLSGLSPLLAPGLLRRALADVGGSTPPTTIDLLRALPKLETRMAAYLPKEEVQARLAQMRGYLASAAGAFGARKLANSGLGPQS